MFVALPTCVCATQSVKRRYVAFRACSNSSWCDLGVRWWCRRLRDSERERRSVALQTPCTMPPPLLLLLLLMLQMLRPGTALPLTGKWRPAYAACSLLFFNSTLFNSHLHSMQLDANIELLRPALHWSRLTERSTAMTDYQSLLTFECLRWCNSSHMLYACNILYIMIIDLPSHSSLWLSLDNINVLFVVLPPIRAACKIDRDFTVPVLCNIVIYGRRSGLYHVCLNIRSGALSSPVFLTIVPSTVATDGQSASAVCWCQSE